MGVCVGVASSKVQLCSLPRSPTSSALWPLLRAARPVVSLRHRALARLGELHERLDVVTHYEPLPGYFEGLSQPNKILELCGQRLDPTVHLVWLKLLRVCE